MKFPTFAGLSLLAITTTAHAKINIKPLTNVVKDQSGYFSDPFHAVYDNAQTVYLSGTSGDYLECDGFLSPGCGSVHGLQPNHYVHSESIKQAATDAGVEICGNAGLHPYQTPAGVWHAAVTLHVDQDPQCEGLKGWSLIVHASPKDNPISATPPDAWVGDHVLIGSFAEREDANYDGKYFRTPAGKLYLVYQKNHSIDPKIDGVVALPMDAPKQKTQGGDITWLLLPDEDLGSENYVNGNDSLKLIETGNMHAINGKFVMAYSVGAYNHKSYKAGVAFSDTFLGEYRKVMKNNPDRLWGTDGHEVHYLLQADKDHSGWRYVGDQVIAPGVPTVAQLGENGSWVLVFAGFDPNDHPLKEGTKAFQPSHRRPYYIDINVEIPENVSVKDATDEEINGWIIPKQSA